MKHIMKSLTNNWTWSLFLYSSLIFFKIQGRWEFKCTINQQTWIKQNLDKPENEILEELNHRVYQKYLESSIFKKGVKFF